MAGFFSRLFSRLRPKGGDTHRGRNSDHAPPRGFSMTDLLIPAAEQPTHVEDQSAPVHRTVGSGGAGGIGGIADMVPGGAAMRYASQFALPAHLIREARNADTDERYRRLRASVMAHMATLDARPLPISIYIPPDMPSAPEEQDQPRSVGHNVINHHERKMKL